MNSFQEKSCFFYKQCSLSPSASLLFSILPHFQLQHCLGHCLFSNHYKIHIFCLIFPNFAVISCIYCSFAKIKSACVVYFLLDHFKFSNLSLGCLTFSVVYIKKTTIGQWTIVERQK